MYRASKFHASKNKAVTARIEDCTKKLVKVFNPDTIIVFGSFAREQDIEDGTIDLLIITETELPFFERIKKALVVCSGGFPSIEPLVYTPEEFNHLLKSGEGFLEDAVEEGIVVYKKQPKANN